MENTMLIWRESVSNDWVTSLSETQFDWLENNLNPSIYYGCSHITLRSNPTLIADSVEEAICEIRRFIETGIRGFEENQREPFDISDEELKDLILTFGRLEKFVEISGTVTRGFSDYIRIPVTVDDNQILEMISHDLCEYGFDEEEIEPEYGNLEWDASPVSIETKMFFDLPTPTSFEHRSQAKKVG